MVFHEITRDAIRRALEETREIDERLVDAQETRRILDRLYGYEVSPVLWKKVMPRLSAGRVQSVATRLVVERERERMRFVARPYWDVLGTFDPGTFEARLVARRRPARRAGPRLRLGRTARAATSSCSARSDARRSPSGSTAPRSSVRSVDEKPYTRRPAAPFRTSTLQQEASRKLRFSSQTTMRVAQRLYENGYITYMRTDSVTSRPSRRSPPRARRRRELYGAEYVPARRDGTSGPVKNAQEAHEAIRPAGDTFRTPQEVERELSRDEHALYDLIWKRTIASQMEDARGQTVSLRLGATSAGGRGRRVRRVGHGDHVPRLPRRLRAGSGRAGRRRRGAPAAAARGRRRGRPRTSCEPEGHATTPPARYTEAIAGARRSRTAASAARRPTRRSSARSSTAATCSRRARRSCRRSSRSRSTQLLEEHFERLVDYDFTARMEDDLDRIAAGRRDASQWLTRFYFGNGGEPGLHALVTDHLDEIDARAVNSIPIPGSDVVVRVGRYGPYLERGDARASIPDDLAPDELTAERAEELLSRPQRRPRRSASTPDTGHEIVARDGRYGPYVTEVLPEGTKEKPRTASLLSHRCRSRRSRSTTRCGCCRCRGRWSAPDGEEIVVANGRYGPFVKKGTETRSLECEEQLFTLTRRGGAGAARAAEAAPGPRRGEAAAQGASAPVPSDGQADRGQGRPLRPVRDGRGDEREPARGDDVEALTLERALELLAERRAQGPGDAAKRYSRR